MIHQKQSISKMEQMSFSSNIVEFSVDKIDDESGSDNIKIKVKLSLEDRGRTYNTIQLFILPQVHVLLIKKHLR